MTNKENGDIMYTKEESKKNIQLDFAQLKIINQILSSGERVEIIPTKDGVKIYKVVRRETKPE